MKLEQPFVRYVVVSRDGQFLRSNGTYTTYINDAALFLSVPPKGIDRQPMKIMVAELEEALSEEEQAMQLYKYVKQFSKFNQLDTRKFFEICMKKVGNE